MRKLLLTFCYIFALGCVSKANTINLIDKVPITPLPIGWSKISSVDSIRHENDYEHSKLIKSECVLSFDSMNKYGLNHIFNYNTLPIRDKTEMYGLSEAQGMIFAKRLPNIGQYRMLIYYVQMRTICDKINLPCWLLLKVNANGTPVSGHIIGGVDWGENDALIQKLYYLSESYALYTRFYSKYADEITDDDGELIDVIVRDEDYIYASPLIVTQLAGKNILKK